METDFDVIVIGAGGAGMTAAITASEKGARVLVVDAADRTGGTTAMSTGTIYAAGTSLQRQKGIEDTPDAAFNYIMTLNQYRADASLIRTFCHDGASALDWLMSIGVEYRTEHVYVAGVDTVARGQRAAYFGAAVAEALDREMHAKGVTLSLKTRVRKLHRDSAGAIAGIEVDGEIVTARAVIVATGGFGADRELMARYYPDAAKQGDGLVYTGSETNKGDGLRMGLDVGATLTGFNCGLLQVSAGFRREQDSYLPGWLLYVNRDGRRFVRETAQYAVMEGVVKAQVGGDCIAIFDEEARVASKVITTYKPLFAGWVADLLLEYVREGTLMRADTLEELAERAGVRVDAMKTTVELYNADCDAGRDSHFFKDKSYLKPIRTPPFYAARIRPCVVVATATGLRIDRHARVLDAANRPVPGLFAAGEATGGVITERYFAGGISIANNVIFGRIAGTNALASPDSIK